MGRRLRLQDLLEQQYGTAFTTRTSDPGATVGAAAVQLMREDPSRIGFRYINLSAIPIYLHFVNTVSVTQGIQVGAGGGSLGVSFREDGILSGLEWFHVTVAAGAAYVLIEYLTAEAQGR